MTKYTTADFENAKFAEHESGQAVALRWTQDYGSDPDDYWVYERPLNNRFSKEATHQEMADMGGWVPVHTKPTLTESRIKKMVGDYAVDEFAAGFAGGFRYAGGEVIPDPEPTNKERLAQLIGGGHESNKHYADGLAEYLDDMGVTAPNVKGN